MIEDVLFAFGAPAAVLGAGYLSYRSIVQRNRGMMAGLIAVLLGFSAFMFAGAEAPGTINWAAYAAALLFISLPAAVGIVVGAIVGFWRRKPTGGSDT